MEWGFVNLYGHPAFADCVCALCCTLNDDSSGGGGDGDGGDGDVHWKDEGNRHC